LPNQPGETTGGASTLPGVGLPGDYADLTSYRSRTTITDLETGQGGQSIAELIIQPFAMRMEMEMGEMIMTEAGVWMEMAGMGWIKTDFTAEELAMSREEFMALEWGGDLEELPDIPPWPSQLLFMPDQAALSLMEGGLTPAGRDNVNGIACQKYNITTNYSYEMEDPVFGGYSREDMEAAGSICVADQADLPTIVIWADIAQTATRVVAGQTVVWQSRIEYEITAVNIPLVIEPPTDALSFEEMFGDWDEDDARDPAAAPADLSGLNSYRLVISIHVEMEGYETTKTSTMEWMREPFAYRYLEESDNEFDFSMETIGVGDKIWLRLMGGDWMEIEGDEEPDFTGAIEWLEDSEMEWVGTAVVNGVRCQHYRLELTFPSATSQSDVWVADQPGYPAVVIRSLTRMEQEGSYTTTTEVNLYDVNQPILIQPPR
jgi:hypothetical protein